MKYEAIKVVAGSYTVYLDNTMIGKVRKIRETSGSATQWKAEGIGWIYHSLGHNTNLTPFSHW